ncbi:MAG: glycoside hydrolase domain-containing protein [Bacteroidota bacterium]
MDKIQNFVKTLGLLGLFSLLFLLSCSEKKEVPLTEDPLRHLEPLANKMYTEMRRAFPTVMGHPFAMNSWEISSADSRNCLPSQQQDQAADFFRLQPMSDFAFPDKRKTGNFNLLLGSTSANTFSPISLAYTKSSPAYYQHISTESKSSLAFASGMRASIFELSGKQQDTLRLFISNRENASYTKINFYPHSGEIWLEDSIPPLYKEYGHPKGLKLSYLIQTQQKYTHYGSWDGELIQKNTTEVISRGGNKGIFVDFPLDSATVLRVKTASSYWNIKAARQNLKAEIPGWDREEVRLSTEETWKQLLGKIKLAFPTDLENNLRSFYQDLYVCSLYPRIYNDVDGLYPDIFDPGAAGILEAGNYYADLSTWSNLDNPHCRLIYLFYPSYFGEIAPSLKEIAPRIHDSATISLKKESGVKKLEAASLKLLNRLGLNPVSGPDYRFEIIPTDIASWSLKIDEKTQFTCKVNRIHPNSQVIESVKLEGEEIKCEALSLDQIHAGGQLEITLR